MQCVEPMDDGLRGKGNEADICILLPFVRTLLPMVCRASVAALGVQLAVVRFGRPPCHLPALCRVYGHAVLATRTPSAGLFGTVRVWKHGYQSAHAYPELEHPFGWCILDVAGLLPRTVSASHHASHPRIDSLCGPNRGAPQLCNLVLSWAAPWRLWQDCRPSLVGSRGIEDEVQQPAEPCIVTTPSVYRSVGRGKPEDHWAKKAVAGVVDTVIALGFGHMRNVSHPCPRSLSNRPPDGPFPTFQRIFA